jgi:hypothetical protein
MKRTYVLVSLMLAGFHTPASFDSNATDGGGNRMYFDGSPRHKGYDCTVCHTGAEHVITATLDGAPAGGYTPGQTYALTATLGGEHLGGGTANNQNGFVAEVVDDAGAIAGTFAQPNDAKTALVDDNHVVTGEGEGVKSWTFAWTAPVAGTGALTLYLGMVDGNGAGIAGTPTTDPGGDDVATLRLRLCEGSSGCADRAVAAPVDSKAAGCSAAGGGGFGTFGLVVLVVAAMVARKGSRALRRRKVPKETPSPLLLMLLAGCFDPTLPGDCPDHVCGVDTTMTDGGASCAENWVCTTWAAPTGSDQATRTCTDKNSVGTTTCKPAETATLPALDLEMYKCEIHPIFQRGCGQLACHGNETDHEFRIYTRGRWRNNQIVNRTGTCIPQTGTVNLQTAGSGTVMCEGWLPHTAEEWKKNFDSSRSFMLGVTTPADSLLVREPTTGGLPHAQVKLFTPGDADYQTIVSWLGGATYGSTCITGKN